jgi:hypothetical protein
MGCNCGGRRKNISTAAGAIRRGDVQVIRREAQSFVRSAAQDVRSVASMTQRYMAGPPQTRKIR